MWIDGVEDVQPAARNAKQAREETVDCRIARLVDVARADLIVSSPTVARALTATIGPSLYRPVACCVGAAMHHRGVAARRILREREREAAYIAFRWGHQELIHTDIG
jgi:hypothetical protein